MRAPYTTADLDAVVELQRSPGYALVVERINQELERRRHELEQPIGIEGTSLARGQVQALRTVLSIPQILQQEMKKATKE